MFLVNSSHKFPECHFWVGCVKIVDIDRKPLELKKGRLLQKIGADDVELGEIKVPAQLFSGKA